MGAVFLIASLSDGTKLLAKRAGWSWLARPGEASAALKAALPPITSLLTWIGCAVTAYVVALVLLSWRHKRPRLVLWGLGVLVASTFVLHGLAWVFVLGRFIAKIIGTVIGFVLGVVGWVVTLLNDHLLRPFVGLFEFLLGGFAWVGAALVVAVVLGTAYEARARWVKGVSPALGCAAVLVGVIAGGRWLIGLVPGEFWEEGASIGALVLGWLLAVVVCRVVGRLFLDQIRSGAHAGSGRRGVVMGAIAVGSTLAVLMLVGNVHGTYALYPADVESWARAVLLSDAPKLDATVTLLVIGLCVLGVLRNLGRMRDEPSTAEFRRSLVFTVVGVYLAGGVAGLDKETSD
ncbi:hypothetical protein [Lentzea sp. CC55]|uniref:hypothetical protein n=1 Tax=Lentzea sp. CC55 TaxID=2884909 RepID=UPI001F473690|nr:hypothetical protein [Lentzea sp. CC55]MCG8927778.1 hypothetical protein [Lentzea sp. CC55]